MNAVTSFNPVHDFFAFLRRPDAERVSASLRNKLLVLAVILALDILLGFAANILSSSIERIARSDRKRACDGRIG